MHSRNFPEPIIVFQSMEQLRRMEDFYEKTRVDLS